MEHVTLMGAEQVQQAAQTMRHAAVEIGQASSQMEEALRTHRRFMDVWLQRFQEIMEKKA